MAEDLQGFALEQADLLSGRLKDLLSSGQGYVRAQFGVDLGLKPEVYPTWVILSTAGAGLMLLLAVSWAAVCGGLLAGKKRGSLVSQGSGEPEQARHATTTRAEEQRKKNKKKPVEKTQSNGRPVSAAQEEVKENDAAPKLSPDIRADKVNEVQAAAPLKKNKKKPKPDIKTVPSVSTHDGREPEDGAWETKVSNREKKQQRRKDKGHEENGGKGAAEASVAAAPTNTKKNRGSLHDSQHSRNTGKSDAAVGAVSSKWREEPSVNGGGWVDRSTKLSGQIGTNEGNKWTPMPTAPHYRAQPEPKSWVQDKQGTWTGMDGRIKADRKPVSFAGLGMNSSEPASNSVDLQWVSRPEVSDEWSGFNGTAAVDASSDWSAPAEHWGNYEEAPVLMAPAPPPKEQPAPNKASEDEKETEDPAGGAAKSKKKKKKKKNAEEEAASVAQVVINPAPKAQELPTPPSNKQTPGVPSSQKRSEQIVEPSKPTQKKKVRRET
ncbi:metadherin a isoform X2 [Genypterus blacodes]|uniref:metadherin a isoform X2 n=1 Tax=Genypterus blacodes TaxID=154954 RepID=UPI003F7748AC